MLRYATALVLLVVPSLLCAQPADEVAAFMAVRWQAWDNRDAEATATLYAADAIVVNVTGNQHIGEQAIAAWYRRLFSDLFPSDLGPRRCTEGTTQMIGEAVAIVTQECTWYDVLPEEKATGRQLPIRHSRVTHVLADRGEGWRIVAFRNIPIWTPFDWRGPNR